jgi:hypothetical protein
MQGGLRNKVHPEPLPSFADRKPSRALCALPLQGRASPYTINAAITPRRDTFVEQITLPHMTKSLLKAAPPGQEFLWWAMPTLHFPANL